MKAQDKVNNFEKSIIKTLSYSDIFSYPLTASEINKYYMGKPIDKKDFNNTLKEMVDNLYIQKRGKYYFLNGRGDFVNLRRKRERIGHHKLLFAKKIANKLSIIPTVKLIGLSGSLSMNNADRGDDIDFFIITSKNSIWMTRLIVTIFLLILKVKRSRYDSYGMDLICPNMFVDESDLSMEENIFIAHEIAQLKVLVDKGSSYKRFVGSNLWVKKILPNVNIEKAEGFRTNNSLILKVLDYLFFSLQFLYMKRRITNETVGPKIARFHPQNKRDFVTDLYAKRCRNYLQNLAKCKRNLSPKIPDLASNFTPGY
ncbi:MAG TPA: hypothetical protein VHE53_03615 [Patescibacteria group bacterium]|nr:hypothetical protein [Patescibacteria group bacterium]